MSPLKNKFVLIIGAGQAGLAMAFRLKEKNIPFIVVSADNRIGDTWRKRYASLTLFTPRELSALPGLKLKGAADNYPTRDEFADYLEQYASYFDFPIRLGIAVVELKKKIISGQFLAVLSDGTEIVASHVIVATGGFQDPKIPTQAHHFSKTIKQFTPDTVGDMHTVPEGTVLVVGDGASGRDIALDLASTHSVLLATGKPRNLLPEYILGRSVWWWLNRLGLLKASSLSMIGKMLRSKDPIPNRNRDLPYLAKKGVKIMPRLVSVNNDIAKFENSALEKVTSIVWAIGYKDNMAWINIPNAFGAKGEVLHSKGISPIEGLYFIGRPWQRNRASALIMGAGEDAIFIRQHLNTEN
ncbi:potassium uptake trka-like protein [Xenorhabdus mauleonii]|uniref:Potassium uptake trka-like protein n=1 Tax=Xenorhabdus mauleonii TaxID=351675 RepID=A0A1I3M2H2_9GAMM|nr:NAD(P)/FAD-dependent oxidoreductase [Xenorhabdus mauleonii]PHM45382.1 potassium uptake trka-like protein [Xenorhabdus mauleonii]SFI91231.1 putative flavoprotein involved in K+ transport [Xenorhabdus mauleonii]